MLWASTIITSAILVLDLILKHPEELIQAAAACFLRSLSGGSGAYPPTQPLCASEEEGCWGPPFLPRAAVEQNCYE